MGQSVHGASDLLICLECRRLVRRRTGYREASETARRCPGCGEPALVEPSDGEAIAVLQRIDDDERLARASRGRRLLARTLVSIAAAGSSATVLLILVAIFFGTGKGHQVAWLLALMLGGLMAIPAGAVGIRAAARVWRAARGLPRPARWALVEPAGAVIEVVQGTLCCDEPLNAPFSGRPCAAYEVGVRADRNRSGAPGTWLLLEQRAADGRVEALAFDGERVRLDLRRGPGRSADDDPGLHAYLEARGVSGRRQALFRFETVLPVGAPVTATRAANGVVTLIAARPEARPG